MNEAVTNLSLGLPKAEVLAILGEPKKTFLRDEYEILQYGSSAPSLADLLYFQAGNLVLKEYSVKKEQLILSDLIAQYGVAPNSYRLYSAEFADSFETTVFVWAEQGRDAIVFGGNGDSQVNLLREFAPMGIDQYEQTFGKNWVVRAVTLATDSAVVTTNENINFSQEEVTQLETLSGGRPNLPLAIGAFSLALVLVVILLVWLVRSRVRRKTQVAIPPQAPPTPTNLPPQAS